jgi:hypothetical protein
MTPRNYRLSYHRLSRFCGLGWRRLRFPVASLSGLGLGAGSLHAISAAATTKAAAGQCMTCQVSDAAVRRRPVANLSRLGRVPVQSRPQAGGLVEMLSLRTGISVCRGASAWPNPAEGPVSFAHERSVTRCTTHVGDTRRRLGGMTPADSLPFLPRQR